MLPAFPKPSQIRKVKPIVKVYAGGREVLDLTTKGGRDEYRSRTKQMLERQGGRCGLQITPQCKAKSGRLAFADAQFDHEIPRGMGGALRDDRILVAGEPKNRAVCAWCNSAKASRRMHYGDTP